MFVCFNRVPEIPLMPIVNVPVNALLLTVKVKVLSKLRGAITLRYSLGGG